ncbi:MAG: hypothetical protein IJ557_02430 [Bacteroidaceae bacterium]|nr:hypothetical protein [Bacteroidaceae bacterium]
MEHKQREVYLNHKQQIIYFAGARHIRLRAGRRFGKTDGIAGPHAGRVVQSMPRGVGIWAGNSNRQVLSRTAPATLAAMQRFWGYQEGVHYWWGQPPAKLNIPKPIIAPKDWSKCITFYNGFVWHLVSMETRGSANSLTVNFILVDEARFVKKEKLDNEVMPTLSGVTHPFGDPSFSDANPWYKGTLFLSDAGLTTRESWMEKEEEKLDLKIESGEFSGMTNRHLQGRLDAYAEKVIYYNNLLRRARKEGHSIHTVTPEKKEEIGTLVHLCETRGGQFRILSRPGVNKLNVTMLVNYKVVPQDDAELLYDHEFLITVDEYVELLAIKNSNEYQDKIRQLRCNTFAYYEASTFDNIDLLGVEYLARMKRDLPPLIYALSILNLKKVKSNDGFYSLLDIENLHGYTAEMPDSVVEQTIRKKTGSTLIGGQQVKVEYESPDFDALHEIKDCSADGDCDDSELYIAMDYNANISWIVTGKVGECEHGGECLYVLSSMFVKNERKLRELMRDWCRYYAPHRKRNSHVTYFYDATAKQRGYAIEQQQDFKDVVIEELQRQGWDVTPVDMGTPMRHELKFKDINEGLAGTNSLAVRINIENNQDLIPAMERTTVETRMGGFRKNKAGEKLPETETDPLELRTDGTDAFDSIYLGCLYFRYSSSFMTLPMLGR